MSGLRTTWKIHHEQAKRVEGTTFVRLAESDKNESLLKLVGEKNPLAKGWNLRSLADCCGLYFLRMVRTQTQARELGAPASTLFVRKAAISRRMPTWRLRCSSAMQIEVPLGAAGTHRIQVLKPGTPRDALYVEFEYNTMWVVIKCLREFGLAPVHAMKLKPDGEKGIQRRKHDKVKKQLGKHKSKWDALELQMENALDREVTQIFQSWRLTKRKTQKKTNKPQKTNKQMEHAANGCAECSQWTWQWRGSWRSTSPSRSGDPPKEKHKRKKTNQQKKQNGACSRCLCILSSNAQEKLCLCRSQCRRLVSQAVSQAVAFAALCAFRVRHYSVAAWN